MTALHVRHRLSALRSRNARSALRLLELALVFGGLPLLFADKTRHQRPRGMVVAALWLMALLASLVLVGDPSFDRRALSELPLQHPHLRTMLLRSAVLIPLMGALSLYLSREAFLRLPRTQPRLFLLVTFLYPLASVLPQTIIWRALFVHRYSPLFSDRTWLLLTGAALFAFAHLAFRNIVAIVVTFIGGALFLDSYLETGSFALSLLEHSAYGLAAFGLGLGRYLYMASSSRALEPAPD
jgi:hypothetical protein